MQLFYCNNFSGNLATLSEDESRHCRVLRKQPGDSLILIDGKGGRYAGRLIATGGKEHKVEVEHRDFFPVSRKNKVCLYVSPTKQQERMEWMLEKAVEIGVDEICFMLTDHSEKFRINMERLTKIAISAMKQSIQFYLPAITGPVKYDQIHMNGLFFIAHCTGTGVKPHLYQALRDNLNHGNIHILIGPEGDFTPEEVNYFEEKGAKPVSLGANRLRTETACVYSLALINAAMSV